MTDTNLRRPVTTTTTAPAVKPGLAARPAQPRLSWEMAGWVAGSLLLAALVWYAAVSGRNPVQENRFPARIPIEVQLDDGLMVTNAPLLSGQVTVRTLQSTWLALQSEDIHLFVDLSGRPPGRYTIPVQGELVNGRGGAVSSISPQQLTIEIAERAEVSKPITVRVTTAPPVGFEVASTTMDTAEVKIAGPRAAVERVKDVIAAISLANVTAPVTKAVTLQAVDETGATVNNVSVTPTETSLTIDVQERKDVTGLQVVPSYIGELPRGYFLVRDNWEPRRIFVRGDEDAIAALNGAIRTEPIDLTGRTQTFTGRYRLVLPPNVTMADPTDITVTVEIEPILVTREFVNIPVQVQGLDLADYVVTVAPVQVNVRITGPQSVIETLTERDISVFAPVSGLGVGQFTVTLSATLTTTEIQRSGITIVPGDQAAVTITSKVNPPPSPTAIIATPSPLPPTATPAP